MSPFDALTRFAGAGVEAAARAVQGAEAELEIKAAALEEALHAAAGPGPGDHRRLAILALKRAVHNRRSVEPSGDPAVEEYRRLLATRIAANAHWEATFLAALATGRRAIVETARDPRLAFGIALASRALIDKLQRLDRRDPASWGHGERHVAAKALAYAARAATKTSPQSVFCATALAKAEGAAAEVSGVPRIAAVDLSLSVAESRKVACVLAADEAVEAAVIPRPNATLSEQDGALTFWKFASFRHATDDESLSRVKDHPVLRAVCEEAGAAIPLPELRRRVAERCGLDEDELRPFLRRMIETGVLIGEIEIPYNERRPLRYVAERAREAGCEAGWIEPALAVEEGVDRLAPADGDRIGGMARVGAALAALPHVRPIKNDELYRLDARGALDVTLPGAVVDELRQALRPYVRLFAALYPGRRYLQSWVDRFLAKFPADSDVPLMDVYRAVTEEADSYRPAAFPEPASDGPSPLEAVRDYAASAGVLDDAVLDRLVPGAPEPPWACGVLFQVGAASPEAIARGEYQLTLNGLFHGAGLSLSRFAHLLGDPVVTELRRAWSVLLRPGAILAELTYNHGGRTANAGLRPSIFEHEIELPGDKASMGARVFGLVDLVVRFDTKADRFVLRLARLGTEVVPVVNSGVNPVGFVSFLVAIGEQGLQPLTYFPGFDAPGITHWPRLVSGKLVLFREHWVFRRGEWPDAPARGDDLVAFARAALRWRERWRLPRHVFVHSSREPKPRYVDLASPVFLDQLRRDLAALTAEKDPALHVAEMLPGPEDLFVRDAEGGYATEFLVQLSGGTT